MYAGTVVERGPVESVFSAPAHPYTRELFRSFTGDGDPDRDGIARDDLPVDGCRFRAECPHAVDACADGFPAFEPVGDGHRAACVYYGDGYDESVVRDDGAGFETTADPAGPLALGEAAEEGEDD
jgi:peptide/nickel transport system ATP-binding protein